MSVIVLVLLILEALFAVFLLYKENLLTTIVKFILATFLVAAAFSVRAAFFNYETLDYQNFLTKWVSYFSENGGFLGLSQSVGNYNIPYLYFLALFSYLPIRDLALIKLLSCLFDVLLAWSVQLLLKKCDLGKNLQLAAFLIVLFLPTVIVNGSLWGQCDSIYVSLALLAIYLALDERPVSSMALFALSFGFKLQAVFLLPVAVILFLAKKYKWYHFLVFPLTYLLLILPAVFLGRSFSSALTLYYDQMSSVGSALNYNSPSLTALLKNVTDTNGVSVTLTVSAITAMLVLFLLASCFRSRLSNRSILIFTAVMATIIPFLLPHMHDRYFFAADVLSLICAFLYLPNLLSAILIQFGSYICYIAYLNTVYTRVGNYYLTNGTGAWAVLLALFLLIFTLGREIVSNPPCENADDGEMQTELSKNL